MMGRFNISLRTFCGQNEGIKIRINLIICKLILRLVRTKGLEPPRRQTLDPKSSAATNYATCALGDAKVGTYS